MRRLQGLLIVKIFIVMIVNLLFIIAVNASGNYEKEIIYKSDDDTKKIQIVFMSEGYSEYQMDKFVSDSKRLMNAIFTDKLFAPDKDKFEVSVLKIPSNQYTFNAYINKSMIFMPNWDAPRNVLKQQVPESDLGILVINSKEAGGRGPKDVAIITSDNEDSEKYMLHEIGHSYAGLADEYAVELRNDPEGAPNVCIDKNNVPWVDLIGKNGIGVYRVQDSSGLYKPSLKCRMNLAWKDDFCEVCANTITKKTKTLFEKYNPSISGGRKLIELRDNTPKKVEHKVNAPITIGSTQMIEAPAAQYEVKIDTLAEQNITTNVATNKDINQKENNSKDLWIYFSPILLGMFPFLKKWIA